MRGKGKRASPLHPYHLMADEWQGQLWFVLILRAYSPAPMASTTVLVR